MVLTLMIPLRKIFHYEEIITMRVLSSVAKTIVLTGLIVAYAYSTEFFMAWYSHNPMEVEIFRYRPTGHYAVGFWIMVICNTVVPLFYLFRRVRNSIQWLFLIAILINIGMWYERFVIIVSSPSHDFMPHAWGLYSPTLIEFGIQIGAFCMFFLLFLLFAKHLPSVSMAK